MKLSVPILGAVAALALAAATTSASAGASTGCWRHLGCAGAPAYGYAPPAYGYARPRVRHYAPPAAYRYEHGYDRPRRAHRHYGGAPWPPPPGMTAGEYTARYGHRIRPYGGYHY